MLNSPEATQAAIIFFLVGFSVGLPIGMVLKARLSKVPNSTKEFVTVLTMCLWAISLIADIALESYATPLPVHAAAGAIIGTFYPQLFSKNGQG